jgi:ubiquinone/menaquinone biosynthesis C-methylase UbiE
MNNNKIEIANSYDRAYSESNHLSDSDSLYRWVLGKLKPKKDKRIIDIACGQGFFLFHAQKRGIKAFGIDISQFAVHSALNLGNKWIKLLVGDGEALPFVDQSFDYASNLGSLEHFVSMDAGLSEMRRVLKDDGQAAIFLPNSYYLFDIIWKVWRTGYSPNHHQIIERFATYNEWKDLIEQNGFIVLKGYKYNRLFPTTLQDWSWYLKFPQRLILALAGPLVPRNLSFHFLFICKKVVDGSYGPK